MRTSQTQLHTAVYLLRHAESRPTSKVPESKWPLNGRGRQQAIDLINVLKSLGIERIYSSPYLRAIQTVQPLAAYLGLEIRVHADLRERKLSDRPSRNFRQLVQQTWANFAFAAPGGESNAGCQQRVVRAIEGITTETSAKRLLVVSHGNAIALYLNSINKNFGYRQWESMKNPDLFKVIVTNGVAMWDQKFDVFFSRK